MKAGLMSSVRRHTAAWCSLPLLLLTLPATAAPGPFDFQDVAASCGIREALRGAMGHAAAWGDADGDGWIDLFVGTFADRPAENYIAGGADGPVANVLLWNRQGKFEEAEQEAIHWLGRASGSVFADLDNDGHLDLYVSNNGRLGRKNLLYRNDGKGHFEDVTARAGAPLELPETARSAAVADLDGDGRLDLIVLGTVKRDRTYLFRNRGDLRFEASEEIPADATGLGLACGDLTGNGWPDVLIGGPNRLFVGMGKGRLREAREAGIGVEFTREDDAPSCGVAFGDVDRDGDADILIGSHEKSPWREPSQLRLFLNDNSTPEKVQFREVTQEAGLAPCPMRLPHVEIRDFDNDGWPDLYTAVVTFRDGRIHPAVYRNLGVNDEGMPQFEETAFRHRPDFPTSDDYRPGMRSGEFYDRLVESRKILYFAPGPSGDFDNDGRLDLFLPSWWPRLPSMLLRNETESGNYLAVEVEGEGKLNRMGIGCVVRAYRAGRGGDLDALIASEEIATGYGYASGQPAIAHLGLGDAASCDLRITVPHGGGEIRKDGVRANQRLKVRAKR